jgi:TetR/AcrR family transcriptional regulator
MQRARQAHQKQERREAILAIALSALEDTPFRKITMTQVAERAGLVKGTLYLYFATKEELFLEVLREQIHGWFWDLEAGLDFLPRRGRLEAAAHLIAVTTASRPAFRRLLGILEQDLPEETVLAFRRERQSRVVSMGAVLERTLPFLTVGQGTRLLLQVQAFIIGLQSMVEPPTLMGAISEHANRPPFPLDFSQELRRGVRALLVGLSRDKKSDRGESAEVRRATGSPEQHEPMDHGSQNSRIRATASDKSAATKSAMPGSTLLP